MPWIATFMRRYRRFKPQLADAALIHLAERENLDVIFTLDRRDFSVYRLSSGRSLQILP
jgi:predicted nucleic acid-binding protein